MEGAKSPVVEREGASAHTLRSADYPYFRPCTSGHRTGTENYHSWYTMLEAY